MSILVKYALHMYLVSNSLGGNECAIWATLFPLILPLIPNDENRLHKLLDPLSI